MAFFGSNWDEDEKYSSNKVKQYFMYGTIVSYNKYKDSIKNSVDDDIQGIFSGRDGKFIILGKVLNINDNESFFGEIKPFEIHKLTLVDERIIQGIVFDKYGVSGNFHYYLIANY